ncbi:MAG: CotH kinase family protein [Melioribacteraceae bacterium]|nr:CotH kinase family protein [Melioribacteraceae bacterium]MDD3559315.1 CotH kinase family protein [Melioribacteraceae bacterium]
MKLITNSLFVIVLYISSVFAQDESWMVYDDSEVALIEITVPPEALEWMYDNVESDSMHVGSVRFKNAFIDETVDSVGIRLRGNTSRYSAKKSFKVDFNEFIKGRKFYGVEKLNVNGEHNDPSIIRSKLCWDIFNKTGIISSRAAHAALYVNGEYYGLYISVEHIDEEFIEKRIPDDSGNLWKCLNPADLTFRGTDPSNYHPYAGETKPYELKTNEDEFDFSQLARLITLITQTPDEDFVDSLESIIDVKEVLQYFAMNVLLGSWDDYWSLMNNYYLYYEPAIDMFHFIPYDYDNTFGIEWWNFDWANIDIYEYAKVQEGPRPLAERIMQIDTYKDLYSHFLEFYNTDVYEHSIWNGNIIELYNRIRPYAVDDVFRTLDYGFTMDDFDNSYSTTGYNNQHVKRGLQEFVLIKNQSVENQVDYTNAPPIVYEIDYEPKNPGPEDSIKVYASCFGSAGIIEVKIAFSPGLLPVVEYYDMQFAPVEGTQIVEENDRWVGTIPPLGDGGFGFFGIEINDALDQNGSYPKKGKIKIAAPSSTADALFINEFLADNESANTDPQGDYEDWVELYNNEEYPVSLSRKFMTDKPDNLTKWQFPENVVIEPGSFLVVWLDEDEGDEGLHANFKLSKGGEYIALVAEDGVTVIDSLSFGEQQEDITYGRFPDGADEWNFLTPTPGKPNEELTSVDEELQVPTKFSLNQNYPNPFNPSTVISYQLSANSKVSLKIYDVLGRQVAVLVNEYQPPGNYKVEFNAKGLSSGIYYYRIESGAFRDTKKMILMK